MKTELLAPAGSMEALKAAVSAGADAVYLGGAAFGARAYAKNLDEQEILSAIDYVHLRNRKLYLTVNTLLKEEELEEKLYPYLRPYYEQGMDAVIVQDMGVLKAVRSWFPDLDIHASTQMTVTGSAGARFLESLGATRVVPARELSFAEIQKIHRTTNLEIECFVHGALCYCYSGQCLFSRSVCSAILAKCLIINVLRLIIVILFFIAFLNITYTARHTFATTVTLANGASLENVSKMLGHSSVRMTQHYAKILNSSIERDMDKIESELIGEDE